MSQFHAKFVLPSTKAHVMKTLMQFEQELLEKEISQRTGIARSHSKWAVLMELAREYAKGGSMDDLVAQAEKLAKLITLETPKASIMKANNYEIYVNLDNNPGLWERIYNHIIDGMGVRQYLCKHSVQDQDDMIKKLFRCEYNAKLLEREDPDLGRKSPYAIIFDTICDHTRLVDDLS